MNENFEEIEFFFFKTAAVAVAFCAMSTAQYFFFHDHSVESTSRQLQTDRNGARHRRENFWLKKKKMQNTIRRKIELN